MSIQTEITRITEAKMNISAAISAVLQITEPLAFP